MIILIHLSEGTVPARVEARATEQLLQTGCMSKAFPHMNMSLPGGMAPLKFAFHPPVF